jgi:thiol:disulfide interchange protein
VRWTALLKIGKGAEAAGLKIHGTLSGQACKEGTCVLVRPIKFVALDTTKKAAAQHVGEYQAAGSNVIIRGHVEPSVVTPGGTVKLLLTAEPQGEYHLYPVKEKPKVAKPTLIVISDLPDAWTASEPTPSTPPIREDGDIHHQGPVTWTVEIKVPKNAAAGPHKLEGGIAYMACIKNRSCEPPKGVVFEITIEVGSGTESVPQPVTFLPSSYPEIEKRTLSAEEAARVEALRKQVRAAADIIIGATDVELYSHDLLKKHASVDLDKLPDKSGQAANSSLWVVLASLGGGFLGGLLLNVMPCVLPVIGLKIMSFLQQGGESRGRVLMLNVWFSLGLISVFMILGALAAFVNLGWGGQFQEGWFTIVLACVVFAFALAMIGVWEIPIPGFIGSSGAVNDLAAKEGPAGAFAKGVLTTVLATPCTGPFLGPALAWAANQPLPLIFATFLAVGLGMASPYLLIGAFPKLIAFLPKPGYWMETFKKLMGFVLLATVVWLLSFVPAPDVVPAVTVMCGLGLAFWWIGSTPLTESAGKRCMAWVQGAAVIIGVSVFSFAWFDDVMEDRAQRRFKSEMVSRVMKIASEPEVYQKAERPRGRYTVMVDFTADWCPTCKTNEQFVLSSKATEKVIEENNIVFLVADITNGHPEAEDLLLRLGNKQRTIPYVAIFPADNPNEPIVLDGLLTQGQLNKALEQAGPSKIEGAATAMREVSAP